MNDLVADRPKLRTLFVALTALSLATVACSDTTEGPEIGADVEDVTEGPLEGREIFEEADTFIGQEVTVSAEVNEVLGPEAFVMAGGDVPDLLVIGATGTTPVEEGDVVKVTGEVIEFVVLDIEEEFGLDLDDELFVDYEDEHAIVASSVEVIDENE